MHESVCRPSPTVQTVLSAETDDIHPHTIRDSMKLLLLTHGTLGDVQPLVALGAGLRQVGHEVAVCTHHRFKDLIKQHDLAYCYMNDLLLDALDSPTGRWVIESARDSGIVQRASKGAQLLNKILAGFRASLEETWLASQGTDAIIYDSRTLSACHIAEKLRIPTAMTLYLPNLAPTKHFSSMLAPNLNLGEWYNRFSYKLPALRIAPVMPIVNRWRKQTLGLKHCSWLRGINPLQWNGKPIPMIHCFSEHLIPPPIDWPSHASVTGFCFLERATSYTAPQDFVDFLESGTPPIYVGFGSMVGRNPEQLTRIIVQAVQQTGHRCILSAGWGGLAAPQTSISADTDRQFFFLVEAVPHEWLFPRVLATVHHGGMGTTAASLKAEKPMVICPFQGDQPFWGRTIHDTGAGPEPIPQGKLAVECLAAAINQACNDQTMRRRASEMGKKICAEEGVIAAVSQIHKALGLEDAT